MLSATISVFVPILNFIGVINKKLFEQFFWIRSPILFVKRE
jgi:hypothetical protein